MTEQNFVGALFRVTVFNLKRYGICVNMDTQLNNISCYVMD